MNTFIITAAIVILWITFIGVSTRIVEDLTEIELDVRQIKKELKKNESAD